MIRAFPLAALLVAAFGCHMYHPTPVASATPEPGDSLIAGELSPRDITGSVTAWEEVSGADSLFRPRITHLGPGGVRAFLYGYRTPISIDVRLLNPAHVAVILVDRCGPYAAVPGRDLTTRLAAGVHTLTLLPAFNRTACRPPSFWRPVVVLIASQLPLHGEVLEERAREAHGIEEVMAGRGGWSAYAVYMRSL